MQRLSKHHKCFVVWFIGLLRAEPSSILEYIYLYLMVAWTSHVNHVTAECERGWELDRS